jgi:DNA-binding NtrC family response regulator
VGRIEATEPILGRDPELSEIGSFLDAVAGDPAGLILEGEAGIGKTTLWRSAVRMSRERG